MDPSHYTNRGKGLPLAELIQALEDDESQEPIDIFTIPPAENDDTDIDEDLSDDKHLADLNCLGPRMLQTQCEVQPMKQKRNVRRLSAEESDIEITNYDSLDRGTCTRYSRDAKEKITVSQSKPLANYNKGMGGVDKMDLAVSSYRTRIRQKKWWWPIFAYLVDVSVSNAWLLMRKVDPKNQFSSKGLLEFRRSIALDLLTTHGTPSSRGKVILPPSENIRFDGRNHLIVYNETERRCAATAAKKLILFA